LEKIKISIVNYTNTLPFKWAIKNSDLFNNIDLQEDIPSICAQKLKFKQVDLALIPVAVLPELDNYFIETDFCIGADGKVDSVKLYSRVPFEKIKTVTLDYQSRTSIVLTKVLMKFFWQKDIDYRDAKPGFENEIEADNAAVVIGDRTFSLNGKYSYEYDLAEAWKQMTGLPFVFAAWISTEKLPEDFVSDFNSVLKFGVDHIIDAVDADYETKILSKHDTINYLTRRIDYQFDTTKKEALKLFLNYIGKL